MVAPAVLWVLCALQGRCGFALVGGRSVSGVPVALWLIPGRWGVCWMVFSVCAHPRGLFRQGCRLIKRWLAASLDARPRGGRGPLLSCGEHDPTSVFWGPVRRGVLSVVLCVVATLVVDGGNVAVVWFKNTAQQLPCTWAVGLNKENLVNNSLVCVTTRVHQCSSSSSCYVPGIHPMRKFCPSGAPGPGTWMRYTPFTSAVAYLRMSTCGCIM